MPNLIILVTKSNIKSLNKNIKKINPKIKLDNDHIELYLSEIVITNDQKKAKWMKEVDSIEELLYPSYKDLYINFDIKVSTSVYGFFKHYEESIELDKKKIKLHDLTMPGLISTINTEYNITSTNKGGYYYYFDNEHLQKFEYVNMVIEDDTEPVEPQLDNEDIDDMHSLLDEIFD